MSKTFFLADDDLDDHDMFVEAVSSLDKTFNVVAAYDGADAVRQLLEMIDNVPDYIFLDLNMPRLNGRECLEQIRRLDFVHRVPVFVYTTSALKKDEDELMRLGASKFITKPASFDLLKQTLRDVVTTDWSGK